MLSCSAYYIGVVAPFQFPVVCKPKTNVPVSASCKDPDLQNDFSVWFGESLPFCLANSFAIFTNVYSPIPCTLFSFSSLVLCKTPLPSPRSTSYCTMKLSNEYVVYSGTLFINSFVVRFAECGNCVHLCLLCVISSFLSTSIDSIFRKIPKHNKLTFSMKWHSKNQHCGKLCSINITCLFCSANLY